MKILPLSIHNISFYKFKFRLESHIRFNSYRAKYKAVLGSNDSNNNNTNTNNNNDNKINGNSDNIETTTLYTI